MAGRAAKACCVLLALLVSACGSSNTTRPRTRPRQTSQVQEIRLPPGTFPRFLMFSRDGSMWVSEDSANAVAQIDRAGRVRQYLIGTNDASPGGLAEASDGAIWFAGFELLGRVVTGGQVTGIADFGPQRVAAVGLPDAITRGSDGALWYTNEARARITRLSPTGQLSDTIVPSGEGGLKMPGITAGPDRAVWFTEVPFESSAREAIGRVGFDGSYRHWTLPERSSGAGQITLGPDHALWFTEESGYRIGRITTQGRFTEFKLPPGTTPFDITVGLDGALWFTAGKQIGRITTQGHLTLWPVSGAKSLIGIVADPHGGFWVADGEADMLDHFTPPSGL